MNLLQFVLMKFFICYSIAINFEFSFIGDFKGAYKTYSTGGGVARLKNLIPKNSLFILVGNILGEYPSRKHAEIAKMVLEKLKPIAIIMGKQELHLDAGDLDWYIRNVSNVLISVNLEHKELNPPQQKFIKKDGVGIAILGYTSESVEMISNNTNFHVKSIIQSLNEKTREITLIYSSVRLFVAAGCTGLESAKEIAARTSLISIIFSSCSRNLLWHDDDPPAGIYKYGPYPLVMKNRDGHKVILCHVFGTNQYLGLLNVTLDEKQKIQSYSGKVMHVNLSLPEDPELAEIVKDEAESPDVMTVCMPTFLHSVHLVRWCKITTSMSNL